jgi:hypothetical protein
MLNDNACSFSLAPGLASTRLCVCLSRKKEKFVIRGIWGPNFPVRFKGIKFITGQNEREETTQDAIVTKSAAFARFSGSNLLLVKMKEKKLLKMQSLPKVLRSQAMRSTT